MYEPTANTTAVTLGAPALKPKDRSRHGSRHGSHTAPATAPATAPTRLPHGALRLNTAALHGLQRVLTLKPYLICRG